MLLWKGARGRGGRGGWGAGFPVFGNVLSSST